MPTRSLQSLSDAACRYGDGELHLTSRANLQMRGITLDDHGNVPAALERAVTDAGLLPSPAHERVRNIIASPLTGLVAGLADLRPAVQELDERLCASPRAVRLPGRFLFGLDDGRDDVTQLDCDLTVRATSPELAQVLLGRRWLGPTVHVSEAAGQLVRLAERFLDLSRGQWRMHELPRGGAELVDDPQQRRVDAAAGAEMPYGVLRQDNGALAVSVLAPLGTLTPGQVAALTTAADHGSEHVRLTPWRGAVLSNLDRACVEHLVDELTASGLLLTKETGWNGVTACTGAPGCSRAQAATRPVAAQIAAGPPRSRPVHVVGCERRCGAPALPHTLVLVTRAGEQTLTTETEEGPEYT